MSTSKPRLKPRLESDADLVAKVSKLLGRYRQAVPLPFSVGDLYKETYPAWVYDVPMDIQHQNLVMALPKTNTLSYVIGGKTFWISLDEPVSGAYYHLYVPETFLPAARKWLKEATVVEDQIHTARSFVQSFMQSFNRAEVLLVWPELAVVLNVQGLRGPGIRNVAGVRSRAKELLDPVQKETVNDMITRCMLLSDKELSAWIGPRG